MSTQLYEDERTGLRITRYCGPVRQDGGHRERFEISRPSDGGLPANEDRMTLSYEEMKALLGFDPLLQLSLPRTT